MGRGASLAILGLSPLQLPDFMSTIVKIRKAIDSADSFADLIANPDPSRPFRNAIGAAGRRVCDGWSSVQPWTEGFIGGALPGPLAGSALLNLVCKPYLEGEGFDPPEIEETPGETGQCLASYRFRWSLGGVEQTPIFSGFYDGPLAPVVRVPGFVALWNSTNRSGFNFNVGIQDNSQQGEFLGWERVDGEPDDCAPGSITLVPGPNPAPTPAPWPVGEEPGLDPTGEPFFYVPDIEDPFGDIPIPDDPFAPELQPGAGDGVPGDGDAIGDPAGEVSGGAAGEDVDFGEPPEGRVWVGCIVETSSTPKVGNIPGTGPGNTVWPTVRANAALNYGSLRGSNNRINSRYHELFRPITSLIVTGVFLQVQSASTAKVFPVSALKCPQNPCGDE